MKRIDRILTRLFLRTYRRRGALVFQKARFQLLLLLLVLAVIPQFVLKDVLFGDGLAPALVLPLTAGFFCTFGLLQLLRTGRYLLSGHLLLLLLFLLAWHDMLFAPSQSYLTRLDTILLLLSALLMAPLLTDLPGLVGHFCLNTLVTILFLARNPEAGHLTRAELQAYATDVLIALTLTGMVSYLLVRTTARARRRAERTNINLETTARVRTRALRSALERIKTTRDEMTRDLELARQVQQALFFAPPAAVTDWDLAVYAQPCAQVSGDFYDFFRQGDVLRGAALFDVAGHGVSSGLITILARSIVLRSFQQDRTPDEILALANAELIQELRGIHHYLTGILLRITDQMVEYANAGHPDFLIRRARGTTRWAENQHAEAENKRGNLMGIAALADAYPLRRCAVWPGDALLLYSDGILEAANEDLEAFGRERLLRSFAESAGDAANRLAFIMAEFNDFMGDRKREDDITLMCLLKK